MWEGSGRAFTDGKRVEGQGSSGEVQNGWEAGTERHAKAFMHQYGDPNPLQASRDSAQGKFKRTWRVVVLRHVHVVITIPDIERPVTTEDIGIGRPRAKMAEDKTLDVAPLERCGRGDVGEGESGEGGDHGEAVDHRSAVWDGSTWQHSAHSEEGRGTYRRRRSSR